MAERAAAERPEQQARRLTGHSCRLARGQLFSRPQAVETGDPPLLPTPCAALDVAMLAD